MYESFFHFQNKPFRLTPDSRFYFAAKPHAKAMAYLGYALQQGEGFLVLTGEPGTGKTTLIQTLKKSASQHHCLITTINANTLDEQNFLQLLTETMGLKTEHDSKASMLKALENYLISLAPSHRHAVVFIDEAHHLSVESLEELRLLTNIQYNEQPLFQCFLIGQTGLKEKLQDPELPQLRQRIIAACHLLPMDLEDTKAYITHRLKQAGHHGEAIFSARACELIHRFSEGTPRRINRLCDRALLLASLEHTYFIDEHFIEPVISELCEEMENANDNLKESLSQQEFNFDSQENDTSFPMEIGPIVETPKIIANLEPVETSTNTMMVENLNSKVDEDIVADNIESEPEKTTQNKYAVSKLAFYTLIDSLQKKLNNIPLWQQHPRLLISAMSVIVISTITLPLLINSASESQQTDSTNTDLLEEMRLAALRDEEIRRLEQSMEPARKETTIAKSTTNSQTLSKPRPVVLGGEIQGSETVSKSATKPATNKPAKADAKPVEKKTQVTSVETNTKKSAQTTEANKSKPQVEKINEKSQEQLADLKQEQSKTSTVETISKNNKLKVLITETTTTTTKNSQQAITNTTKGQAEKAGEKPKQEVASLKQERSTVSAEITTPKEGKEKSFVAASADSAKKNSQQAMPDKPNDQNINTNKKSEQQLASQQHEASQNSLNASAANTKIDAGKTNIATTVSSIAAKPSSAGVLEKPAQEKPAQEKPAQEISEATLSQLLQRFSQAYQKGDLSELQQLLDESVQSNDGRSLKVVSKEYAQLFRITQQRQLTFERLQWQLGSDRAHGSGQFQAQITELGRDHSREFSGTIDLVVNTEKEHPKIAEIYYSYDN